MNWLANRIDRLERDRGGADGPYIVVTDGPNESSEAAIARYRAEHPDTPDRAGFIVFVSGFAVGGNPP